jgi:WS/DGAT/MGAT family acyltransferase
MDRLSALDASFLAVEGPDAPMHVGWVAQFDGPSPAYELLLDHIAGRMGRAPRFRQRLAEVPLAVHDPVWVDDPEFDPTAHLPAAEGDLGAVVDAVLSTPLRRDRPLWEITIVPGERLALIGKMHHCMVDGIAAVQLANVLLDPSPDGWREPDATPDVAAAAAPNPRQLLAHGLVDRTGDLAALALVPPAPASPLNRPGSARRHHIRVTRDLDEIRAIRKRFQVTPNDVLLAACAGALRRFAGERRLKVMVPADVRVSDDADTGNRISFVFFELPCDEPDPVERLRAVNRATAQRARDDTAATLDAAFRTLALTPAPVQHALAHAFAHPRLFNLTISSVPGPAVPRYLHGCRLDTVHSAVPLGARHALSIGIVTVAGKACLGVSADADALPDADGLAADLDAAFDELACA